MAPNSRSRGSSPRAPGRKQRHAPIDFVSDGQWPYAQLATSPEMGEQGLYTAVYAQALAAALTEAIGDQSHRAFAMKAEIPARTLDYLLAGRTVPDIATLAHLEVVLGQTLLPADRLSRLPKS